MLLGCALLLFAGQALSGVVGKELSTRPTFRYEGFLAYDDQAKGSSLKFANSVRVLQGGRRQTERS
jgi:hypothetical protein